MWRPCARPSDGRQRSVALVHPADGPGPSGLLTAGCERNSRLQDIAPPETSFWSSGGHGPHGTSQGRLLGGSHVFLSLDRRCTESGRHSPWVTVCSLLWSRQDLWSVQSVAFNVTGTLSSTTRSWGLLDPPHVVAGPRTSAVCPQLPCVSRDGAALCPRTPGLYHTQAVTGAAL